MISPVSGSSSTNHFRGPGKPDSDVVQVRLVQTAKMEVIVVKSESTRWDEEGRLQGNLQIPLSPEGMGKAGELGAELAMLKVKRIYSGFSLPAYQTACIISDMDGRVSVRRSPDLDEVDFGLWQGLLDLDLKRKHRRAYFKWLADPASIEPPGGERLGDAYQRLVEAVESVMHADRKKRIMVVTGRYACALLACYFKDAGLKSFWEVFRDPRRWELFAV